MRTFARDSQSAACHTYSLMPARGHTIDGGLNVALRTGLVITGYRGATAKMILKQETTRVVTTSIRGPSENIGDRVSIGVQKTSGKQFSSSPTANRLVYIRDRGPPDSRSNGAIRMMFRLHLPLAHFTGTPLAFPRIPFALH